VFENIEVVLREIKTCLDHPDPADFVGGSVPPEDRREKINNRNQVFRSVR
jgi:hypothetical protein